jgi:hypothetical protein
MASEHETREDYDRIMRDAERKYENERTDSAKSHELELPEESEGDGEVSGDRVLRRSAALQAR